MLRDPLNVGIANNVIPRAALSPQSLTFLEYMPQPNTQQGTFNFSYGIERGNLDAG